MAFPCIAAARSFESRRHAPFFIGAQRVGWIRLADLPLLERWPHIFELDNRGVMLERRLDSAARRSAALKVVIDALAAEGLISGWRDEIYAIRNDFDDAPLAFIERAASRFFGTLTYAAHVNGIMPGNFAEGEPGSSAPSLWLGRRSHTKATDPGMLDNLVGGGIGWGYSVAETLVKECWEESGIAASLAAQAVRGRTLHVLQEIQEGTQAEQIIVFDLVLPAGFSPANQDGEVADHRLARIDEVAAVIAAGAMTVDASLATLDCLLRHGWVDAASCAGIDALFSAPRIHPLEVN